MVAICLRENPMVNAAFVDSSFSLLNKSIISEFFREPDAQIGYLFDLFSMGTILSFFMILSGLAIMLILQKKNEN